MTKNLKGITDVTSRLESVWIGDRKKVGQPPPGYSQLLRVQLAETLLPGARAQMQDLLVDRAADEDTETPQDRFKVLGLDYEVPYVYDLLQCNFAGEGEWLDCRWRSDLGLIQPVGEHGLTQRGVVRDGTITTSTGSGLFRIARRKPNDTYDETIQVTARTDYFNLPAVLTNGTVVLLRYIPDHYSIDYTLSEETGEWVVIAITGGGAVVGMTHTDGIDAMAGACPGVGVLHLYELQDVSGTLCLVSISKDITIYNMCGAIDGDVWVQAKLIGSEYWVDVVCCP